VFESRLEIETNDENRSKITIFELVNVGTVLIKHEG
jgi:hypothetical protein